MPPPYLSIQVTLTSQYITNLMQYESPKAPSFTLPQMIKNPRKAGISRCVRRGRLTANDVS